MLPLGTKGNTHTQMFMQTYAKCLYNYEKNEINIIFRWQYSKLLGAQNRKCVLCMVCHLMKELILTHQATPINLTAAYMYILNN